MEIGGVRLGVSETVFFHRVSPCIPYTTILLVITVPKLSWLHFSLLESVFGIRPYRGIVSSQRFEKHSVLNLQGHWTSGLSSALNLALGSSGSLSPLCFMQNGGEGGSVKTQLS